MDWEETIYLNLIIHQLHYTMTLAVCSRTSPKNLQVLRRFSQKVYATPSRRKMEAKGDTEEMTYPYLSFTVDNYEDMFKEVRKVFFFKFTILLKGRFLERFFKMQPFWSSTVPARIGIEHYCPL